MRPALPGTRLCQLLRPWLPSGVSTRVLEPAVADLQYEIERANTTAERRLVMLRGYVGIAHALVLSIPAAAARAAAALGVLCGTGALLVITARAMRVDVRLLNSAILAPGMLAPAVMRLLGISSPHRLFAASVLVAMSTTALAGGFGLDGDAGLWRYLAHALVALVLFAPIAGAAAVAVGRGRETFPKRMVTAVSVGSGIATAVSFFARWPTGQPLVNGLAMTPFYMVLFGAVFALTLLPLLLLARAFTARPALLVIAGVLCSPAPVLFAAYIDHGTFTACFEALRRTPLSFATWSLPFIMGATAVGWQLPPGGVPENSPSRRS